MNPQTTKLKRYLKLTIFPIKLGTPKILKLHYFE